MITIDSLLKVDSINDHYEKSHVDLILNTDFSSQKVNFWFNGLPGTGKTTFAHLLGKHILGNSFQYDFWEFNSSHDRGIDFVKDTLFELSRKYCVILLDEADGLTKDAQDASRRIIETGKAIFILTSNYSHKISQPLKDRLTLLEFNGPPKKWIWEKLKDNPSISQDILKNTLKLSKNSFRDISKNYSSLSLGQPLSITNDELLKMSKKDFIDYSWTADTSVIITRLHKEILASKAAAKEEALLLLADIDYKCSQATTKALQIQTGFIRILKILGIQ
jgi:hypothetical protein